MSTASLAGRALALLAALALSGCVISGAEPGADSVVVTESSASPEILPLGDGDLSLVAGRYRSPPGFEPALTVSVPAGWTSVHRAGDGFDLGLGGDDLLVAVAFLVPAESTAEAAVDAVLQRGTDAGSAGRPTTVRIGSVEAAGYDILGGGGPLVTSAARAIALDAVPGGRLRTVAVDVDGRPLLVAVFVPDAASWNEAWEAAEPLITTTRLE